jgi:Tfp pilus assembly protein PilF
MFSNLRFFALILVICCSCDFTQAQSPKVDPKPDYSKEAFVVEQTSLRVDFENDGTGKRESLSKIRIQSDAGVQRYGVLTLPYQNLVESLDIDYVRVHKPDGTVVSTPAENIQDMPTEITRQAPFYSDLHEKQVAVKGLRVGDMLEFHATWQVTKPLAPGQFWYAYNFSHDGIILQEELQISMPKERAIKWKSTSLKPNITEVGARRIFSWTSSQLTHKSSEEEKTDQEEKLYQLARGKLPAPEVQISSFQSWEELGRWYGSLQKDRVKPTDEIRAKATELTKAATDDTAKLRALYKYVSAEFRYIGVAFGIGRYQPHSAADVLSNQYGDCKDKHTLLASLLDAAGIKAYPALINSVHEIDPDVPSPAQFDHMITAVPQKDKILWLDTTSELAPFAYLLSPLHDKPALVVTEDKPSSLITTAGESPSRPSQSFSMDAKLSENGTLEGKVLQEVNGADSEVIIRLAFRRVPLPNWKDLVQQMSYAEGFAGDVSEVTAGVPEKTEEPFHFSYNYNRKDFPDWPNRRVAAALPPFSLPAHDTQPAHPIWLGAPQDIHYESHVQLPPGYSPQLPAAINLNEDFAEYHASYSAKGNVLSADRKLIVKLQEVPEKEYETYKKFKKKVEDDYNDYVPLLSGSSTTVRVQSNTVLPRRAGAFETALSRLPDSTVPEASSQTSSAQEAIARRDLSAAVSSLKGAVAADPKFARAWILLGSFQLVQREDDEADDSFQSALKADPNEPIVYKAIAYAYMGARKFDDAVTTWQDMIKIDPKDVDGPTNLGFALLGEKLYVEAAAAFESAAKLGNATADLQTNLGVSYMHAGDSAKSVAAYQKAVELDPKPVRLNDIAYTMSNENGDLPAALDFAERAVRGQEEATLKFQAADLQPADLTLPIGLAAFWDTLGWVHFRMRHFDLAEKYLDASWALDQDSQVAGHLGEVYQAQGKRSAALHMYRLALSSAPDQTPIDSAGSGLIEFMMDMRRRIEDLGGDADTPLTKEADELRVMRIVHLPRVLQGTAVAEFFLVFAPDSKAPGFKIDALTFVNGAEKVKAVSSALKPDYFKVVFPDQSPMRILRRGVLGCYEHSGCSFVLTNPRDVHSVK